MKKLKRAFMILLTMLMVMVCVTACAAPIADAVANADVNGQPASAVLLECAGKLLLAVITVLGALLTYYVKTYLVPWLEEKRISGVVKRGVECAEQLAKSGTLKNLIGGDSGADKKKYVKQFLKRCGIEYTTEIDAMLEAAVYGLKNAGESVLEAITGETLDTEVDD